MFIEDDGGWPGVGFNPAKGDTEAVDHLARDVAAVGRELEELEELLTSVGKDDGWWRGDAANKFREKLGSLPKYLQQGSDSMQACSSALHRYHGYLTEMQSHAQSVEAEAIPARKDADAKRRRRVDLADQYAGRVFEVDEAERIQRTIDDAAAAESAATDKLNSLIREAEDIHAKWKDRAGEAERAILKASENHPPDLSVWSRVADGLKEAWGDFKDFLVDHADLLSTISAGLAVAALAVNVVPVAGQVASGLLGGASAVCAAGAMAGHWMGNARGNGTPAWKIGLDALGVIPGVGGAVKGAIAGAKAVRGAGLVAKAGAAGGGIVSRAAAMGVREGLENPLSMKGINAALGKVAGKTLPQQPTQLVIKGVSAVKGTWHELTTNDDTTVQAPAAPDSSKYRKALAA
ncbi:MULTISPECIES: putative T7SS-secreted protein [unclassified Streptomyces]|uniref:putative T7SS-secreted protein n=2 Tax=unclassified Streptomyces TaxID=2593676 RepID=UPI002E198C06|nr:MULTISPECIES: hypothetical protein [unclassified Streptomyces]